MNGHGGRWEGLKIVVLATAGAILYGEIQDHSLIRFCPQYFTKMHPDVFGTADPTLLALGWGVLATWWVGLALGGLLAFCARSGQEPRLNWRALIPGIGTLFLATGLVTSAVFAIADRSGFTAPSFVLGPVADEPLEVHRRVSVMLAAYNSAYGAAFLGGILLCAWTIRERAKLGRGTI